MINIRYTILSILAVCLCGCVSPETFDNTAEDNFECLWQSLDEHYCYFQEKGIDWQGVRDIYLPRAKACRSTGELFDVCAQMLDTLRDGHVNLISTTRTSYYRKWWTDYPQDFNLRTVQEHYLHFGYLSASGMIYGKLMDGRVGYIYYPSFSAYPGANALDGILAYFSECDGLVIDIRNNGGGLMTSVEALVSRFIEQDVTGGYIRHKTGPGHNEFSKPFPLIYHPASQGRLIWHKPVVVLTNRSCFSAANDFACVMKGLPGVTLAGAKTGGGGGLPFSSEVPCGWSVRFSACPVTDADGYPIEDGIDPSPGCEVHCTDVELASGLDRILDFGIGLIVRADVE